MARNLLSAILFAMMMACSAATDVPSGTAASCSSDNDCERPLSCLLGQCREKICEPGLLRCNDLDLEVCTADGQGFTYSRVCSAGCDSETNRCKEAICAAFATRCEAGNKERCVAGGGAWVLEEECAEGCVGGDCVDPGDRVCDAGQTRCAGDSVEACNEVGNGWMHTESCAHGCAGGECVGPPCPEGQVRCDGDTVVACGQFGWRYARACDYGCREGNCLESVCDRGAVQCRGADVEHCAPDQRSWLYRQTCQGSCVDGACEGGGGGCREGQHRCNGDMLEVCNNSATWETERQCEASCRSGACTSCRPGAVACDGLQPQRCSDDGAALANRGDACETSCVDGLCGLCVPGARRCSGANIELCEEGGQGWSQLSACLTSCADGACTLCTPGAVRCFGRTVQTCAQDGSQWVGGQECNGACQDGACQGELACVGGQRCSGQNVERCYGERGWMTVESCMAQCDRGACVGAACLPIELSASPAQLPADGSSSSLISSALILSNNGTTVPDGSLFTVSVNGGTLLTRDGDPNTPGVQVRSLNGRIDFAVQAPAMEEGNQVPQPITATATHPVAGRCTGSIQLTFVAPANSHHTALDFTSGTANDGEITTALWDTALGRVDPFPSDFGAGQDGDLVVSSNYNINSNSQPGRLFPDAVNFIVTEVAESSVRVSGGVGGLEIGDEVLLINMRGTPENHGNVGNYEIVEVARINYGANTVFFTTSLTRLYGAADSNADLTGQKIMLQRVPRYRSLVVNGGRTLSADAWNGEKGGVFFIKVQGSAEVHGSISMDNKGYRAERDSAGESFTGPALRDTVVNGGGGGGSQPVCGGSSGYNYYSTRAGGGSFGSLGRTYSSTTLAFAGEPGALYGRPDLPAWFLGSAGGQGHYQRCYYSRYYSSRSSYPGGNGGGIVVVWSNGLSVRGDITARGLSGTVHGSGGSVFLRARSMNVGNGRVLANSGSYGGDGRIRLDYFGLAGTTAPEFHAGFAGDTVMQTGDLSGAGNPLLSATLSQAIEDRRGGVIRYQVTNGATDEDQALIWHDIAPGETVTFPDGQAGSNLRLRATFSNDNLRPLALIGLSLTWNRRP